MPTSKTMMSPSSFGKNIVCRFGIPQAIVVDNKPQFNSIAFRTFYSELKIKNLYSTPRYPQSNEQMEATNKTLLTALKKELEEAKGKWVDELLEVLWAYRTTLGQPIRNTPFALAYGMETIILIEIGMPIAKTVVQSQRDENQELERHLDLTNEERGNAAIRMASYQQRVIAHYNKKAQPHAFRVETLVLKRVFENTAEKMVGKLQANWEGPYIVVKARDLGAYHLQTLNKISPLRPWNVSNLKQYYQ